MMGLLVFGFTSVEAESFNLSTFFSKFYRSTLHAQTDTKNGIFLSLTILQLQFYPGCRVLQNQGYQDAIVALQSLNHIICLQFF